MIQPNSILNGDCLELMKEISDGSIDCIITDPPYELDNHGGGNTELAQRDLDELRKKPHKSSVCGMNCIFF